MLGQIKRNFSLLCRDSFIMLYKTVVRSHLEYANAVWNPYREGLIKDLERVQMRATKLVSGLRRRELQRETYGTEIANLEVQKN